MASYMVELVNASMSVLQKSAIVMPVGSDTDISYALLYLGVAYKVEFIALSTGIECKLSSLITDRLYYAHVVTGLSRLMAAPIVNGIDMGKAIERFIRCEERY